MLRLMRWRPGLCCSVCVFLIACSTQATASPSAPINSLSSFQPSQGTPSTGASPNAPDVPDDWTRVVSFGDPSTHTVGSHIVFGASGFLAVSTRWTPVTGSPGPGRAEYSLAHSSSGLDWAELDYPEELGSGLAINALATDADGAYVLYGVRPKIATHGTETVVLRSIDGVRWHEIASGLPKAIAVQAIEQGPAGYLLVGGQTAETNPTLWLSAGGDTWELVHEFRQTERWIQIEDADGGEEGYVVIGRAIEPDGPYERFAFASADGRNWIRQPQPFGADDQGFLFDTNVSSLGPDWIATLGEHEAPTRVWHSANGLAWSEVATLDTGASSGEGMFAEIDDELVLSPGSGYYEGTPGVWFSSDGVDWAPVKFGEELWLGGIAQGDGLVATIGTVPSTGTNSTAGVWVRRAD
jgi:hypothetical protein